jgi:hypothetical protein
MPHPGLLELRERAQAFPDLSYYYCLLKTREKKDYIVANMWQPIALLNILDKVIETILIIYLHEP